MTRPALPVVLIAGPTASGKSALALRLAEARGGLVINADSMQVYRELAILTARPEAADEARAPHRLYGHVPAARAYSVAQWLEDVAGALAEADRAGLAPIVVGGTGLYFKALAEGLAPVPPIPEAIRVGVRDLARTLPPGALHARLAAVDHEMADRLAPGDTQRISRALEVVEATGRSLAHWQRDGAHTALLSGRSVERHFVDRPRELLRALSEVRFDRMMALGALDEVRGLLALALSDDAPVMRALGVGPLRAHLEGRRSIAEAVARAKLETHQYVKRQRTWARRYMADWPRHPAEIERELETKE